MKNEPLVSVCMPVYNAERYLAQALESVFLQSHRNVEIICVDDGSSDSSLKILKTYEDRVHIIESTNHGAPHARNLAFAKAKGEVIQFFDADNLLDPEKISRQLDVMKTTGADLVFCNKRVLKGDSAPVDLSSLEPLANLDPFLYCLRHNLPGGRAAIDTDVPLHRREILEKIGGFRLGVVRGQDKDLALRLAAAGAKFEYLDEVLVTYRDHDGPRISNQAKSSRFHVDYFIAMIQVLSNPELYVLTQSRRQELAIVLSRFSKAAYRNGNQEAAAIGFRVASEFCDYSDPQQGILYSILQKTLGYKSAEKLRQLTHR